MLTVMRELLSSWKAANSVRADYLAAFGPYYRGLILATNYGLSIDSAKRAGRQSSRGCFSSILIYIVLLNLLGSILLLLRGAWGKLHAKHGDPSGLLDSNIPFMLALVCVVTYAVTRTRHTYTARRRALRSVLLLLNKLAMQRSGYRFTFFRPAWRRKRNWRAGAQQTLEVEAQLLTRSLATSRGDMKIDRKSVEALGRWMCWAAEDLHSKKRVDYLIGALVDTTEYLVSLDPDRRLSLQYPPREAVLRVPTYYKKVVYLVRAFRSPAVLAAVVTLLGALVSLIQKFY